MTSARSVWAVGAALLRDPAHARYVWAQARHSVPKRGKPSRLRAEAALAVLMRHPEVLWLVCFGARVLCIGPRNVDELETLDRAGWRVDGVDLFPTHSRIRRGDIGALPYPAGSYDLIYCAHCLEHSRDVVQAAGEIARVLVPSGLIWLAVPRGGEQSAHDIHRFDRLVDLTDPFRAAGVEVEVLIGEELEREVRALLRVQAR